MGRLLAVLIWVLTILSVSLFFVKDWWFPPAITSHGPAYDQQFLITIVIVGISFVLAQVALGYMLWRYRDTGEGTRALYTHGSNRLEIVWTIITGIIFIGLALLGQRVWASLHFQPAPPGTAQVKIVAQQFQWNFHYPGTDRAFGYTDPTLIRDSELNFVGLDDKDPRAKDDAVVSGALVVPLNRPVELILRAKDVTHAIWVPPLRFKQDLVPGMEQHVHFTATKVGLYELACAELCGQLHYKMRSNFLVLPDNEYDELMAMAQGPFQKRVGELIKKYEGTLNQGYK
jgi:cytochrome c oxidase subunit 2